jgi:hypothetical protein
MPNHEPVVQWTPLHCDPVQWTPVQSNDVQWTPSQSGPCQLIWFQTLRPRVASVVKPTPSQGAPFHASTAPLVFQGVLSGCAYWPAFGPVAMICSCVAWRYPKCATA